MSTFNSNSTVDHNNIYSNSNKINTTRSKKSDKISLDMLSFPIDVLRILLTKYLTLQDLSILDVAYCNHKSREQLLSILSTSYFEYGSISFHHLFQYSDLFLMWIGRRRINISGLSIKLTDYSYSGMTTNITDGGLICLLRYGNNIQIKYKNITNTTIIEI